MYDVAVALVEVAATRGSGGDGVCEEDAAASEYHAVDGVARARYDEVDSGGEGDVPLDDANAR